MQNRDLTKLEQSGQGFPYKKEDKQELTKQTMKRTIIPESDIKCFTITTF